MIPEFAAPFVRLTSPSGCPSLAIALNSQLIGIAIFRRSHDSGRTADIRWSNENGDLAILAYNRGGCIRLRHFAQNTGAEVDLLVRLAIGYLCYIISLVPVAGL